ncbi:MAG: hypothetical protein M0Z28_19310 [Rhodospirillales bacterium]|nr:hypothetical protein [Rhodospirillales bacterium]
MPFDTAIPVARLGSLAEVLEENGIAPVPLAALAAHKRAQVQKFGPNFWYRHQGLLLLGLLLPFVGMAATSGLADGLKTVSPTLPATLSFAWLFLLPLLFATGLLRLRAGSHWEERWVPSGSLARLGVPGPIAELGRDLQKQVPGSALILGELVQERAVLDPYLMLVRGGERVCLGIWDGGKILVRAA